MRWKNIEDQLMIVKIYDALAAGADNPYNIEMFIVDNGNGTQTVTFHFSGISPLASNIIIGYAIADGPATYIPGSPVSPRSITIPTGTYVYSFEIEYPDWAGLPNEVFPNVNLLASQIADLKPGSIPFELSVIDNDEDKHNTIRAKQAVFKVLTDANFSLSTFCGDNVFDRRYYVTVEVNEGKFIFKGHLVLDDLEEPFLSPKNELTLKATDGLGLLKDRPLLKPDGTYPRGYNKIGQYLAWALQRTGHSLPINVVMNIKDKEAAPVVLEAQYNDDDRTIRVDSNPFFKPGLQFVPIGTANNGGIKTILRVEDDGDVMDVYVAEELFDEVVETTFKILGSHLYNYNLLEAKTFEKNINEAVDCYTVLRILLAGGMYVTQEKGEWWVMRLDEKDGNPVYVTEFDANGNWVADRDATAFPKSVSRLLSIKHINKLTKVQPIRPMGMVKQTYNYNQPKEIVCNINFERGEFIEDMADEVIDGVTYQAKKYSVECWDMRRLFDQPINSSVYIKRLLNNGYENERYLVITPAASAATPWSFLQCEEVEVAKDDKINVGVDFKFPAGMAGGGVYHHPFRVFLLDDDGNYWYWWHPTSNDPNDFYWTGPEAAEVERSVPDFWVLDNVDETKWRSFSVELAPLPANGRLFIGLNQMNQDGSGSDNQDVHYQNLQFSIAPNILNSYRKFNGQYFSVTQPGEYFSKKEEEIYISDALRKVFKGAIFYVSDYRELYDGELSFSASGSFNVPGNRVVDYPAGKRLRIISANNKGFCQVATATYHIVGDVTTVTITGMAIAAIIEDGVISQAVYSLSKLFYNAAVFPAVVPGDEYFHPYGHLLIYDSFNQHNRVMRTFRATMKGLSGGSVDLLGRCDAPALMHRYGMSDGSDHGLNKFFQLLSFNQDYDNCQWNGVFKEVFDITKAKVYTEEWKEFKYIES